VTKAEVLERMRTSHRQLERHIFYFEKKGDGIFRVSDRPKFDRREMESPGVIDNWSLKDVLAHLVEWEQKFIDWYHAGGRGEVPETPAPGYSWRELDQVNQQIFEKHHPRPVNEILVEFQVSYCQMVATIEKISEQELFETGVYQWTGLATLEEYVAGCGYEHYDWAKEHVIKWKKRHTGKQLNKEIILDRIRKERRRLQKNLDNLTPEQMTQPGVIDGWSVKDILAHLLDWEQRFLGWYRAGLRGEVPQLPAPGLTWSRAEMHTLNQQIYERYKDQPLGKILNAFASSYQEILQTVNSIPEIDMFKPGRFAWTGKDNLAGYILANTADHYRWAKTNLRSWMRAQGII
jgi:hypothetical protein